ncbi:MAG TPA: hypothetical protein VFA60_08525 [Terriglobales bacterium]|nr:hypothetical protein [Terriglobales bacterium]
MPELYRGRPPREHLLMPLTVAYLLSAELPFCCPVHADSVAVLDAAFDEILRGLTLESCGVTYLTGDKTEVNKALDGAVFVLSDERGEREAAARANRPYAVLSSPNGSGPALRVVHADRIPKADFAAKLAGCEQLLRLQARGITTGGPFSLSW